MVLGTYDFSCELLQAMGPWSFLVLLRVCLFKECVFLKAMFQPASRVDTVEAYLNRMALCKELFGHQHLGHPYRAPQAHGGCGRPFCP